VYVDERILRGSQSWPSQTNSEAASMYTSLAQSAPHVAIRARIMCFAAEGAKACEAV